MVKKGEAGSGSEWRRSGDAYNSMLVPPAEVPTSALDFIKPLFQDKLITTDPTEDDAALTVFNMIVGKYGWSYMDRYVAQRRKSRGASLGG
jgi:ABC-type Fe3+ transport system substrate-binding protein